MKNKIIYTILIYIFCHCTSFAQDQFYNFETKTIEITEDGNLLKANYGKVVSSDKNFEIKGNEFLYSKNTKILNINGDGSIQIRSNNLYVEFDIGFIDQKKFIFEATGEVKVKDLNRNLEINSNKIVFNYKENILISSSRSQIIDNYQNKLITENFEYNINKEIIKLNELNLTDRNNNNLKSSIAYINTKTNNLYGKNIFINLRNETLNKNNEPRLKGNSIINNDVSTKITKGVFTTCKKRDGCPPWELSAKKIEHDKKNKIIKYENAFLKIYDKPIAYFPKFSHPDPTVDRKSGFLTPSLKNSSNSKNFLSLPYYLVVSENSDLTFSPRLYDHEEVLLQTEYRKVNSNSNHISDFSFKINDDKKLKSHFFYEYNRGIKLDNFIDSNFDFKIQSTSKDTYIKKNKIKSKLINSENLLENSAKLSLSRNDMSVNFETIIYEDLDKNDSDRYEFLIPKIDVTKKIKNKTNLNGDFTFKSQALTKNYNTNIFETININDLIFQSNSKVTNKGFYNNYEFIIKNTNTNAENSLNYKNKENVYMSGLLQFNSSLPLIKENNNYKKILNPKLALKISPNHTKDNRNDDFKINTNNIYNLNRAVKQDMIEGGLSLTYGNEFSVLDKENFLEVFGFKVANNIRIKENSDLPRNSQIGQKTSSILTEIFYQPNDHIKFNYNTSIKNDLTNINYENLTTEFKINNIVTNFDYLNENNSEDNIAYLSNTTKLLIDNSNQISFSTRRNKTIDLTEYYNLAYQYKNDCLTASVEYNKEYYSDRDLKPNESIFLKLSIIPFNKDDPKFLK
ncbi:LPS-assembly protein LptD [Pelagibacterales bacterium SAG-MED09]|nr:LPS-assembly protein LptD [Pelagibacterales bacterium SAG-MED09]